MKKQFLILILPFFFACSADPEPEPEEVTGYFLTLKPDCTPKGLAAAKQFKVLKYVYTSVITKSEAEGYCEVFHTIEDINGVEREGYLESYYESN